MKLPLPFALFLATAAVLSAQEKARVADLAFLAGHWRGPSSTAGVTAEEFISPPEGGVMVSSAREFRGDRCIFYDFMAFVEKDGGVQVIPHPMGRRSPRVFPLVKLDAAAKRVIFENKEHDFPKSFTYEIVAPDRLRITLQGERKGQPSTEVLDLQRVP